MTGSDILIITECVVIFSPEMVQNKVGGAYIVRTTSS